jgi:WD40 repeat protein
MLNAGRQKSIFVLCGASIFLLAHIAVFSMVDPAFGAAPSAAATSSKDGKVLDVDFDPGGISTVNAVLSGSDSNKEWAQTFTVGKAGLLAEIDVFVRHFPPARGKLWMDLRRTGASGIPTFDSQGIILTASIDMASVPDGNDGYVFFDVSGSRIRVNPGDKFAVAIRAGEDASTFKWFGLTNNPYPKGEAFDRQGSSGIWSSEDGCDLGIRIYISNQTSVNPTTSVNTTPVNQTPVTASTTPAFGRYIRTFKVENPPTTKKLSVGSAAFSPDGQTVLIGTAGDNMARIWDIATGGVVREFQGHKDHVETIAFSQDGHKLLTGSFDSTVVVWNADTGEQIRTLQGHRGVIKSVGFNRDGSLILTCAEDGKTILWDAETGKQVQVLEKGSTPVRAATFSPDGRLVLTGADNRTSTLWDATSGKQIRTFQGHSGAVRTVAFSPDGTQIITGALDNLVILWDVETGNLVRKFQGHSDQLHSVAFSPDGRFIISGAYDLTARIWEVATGKQIDVLREHTGRIHAVAFSPDGRLVLTGSQDGTAILWDVSGIPEAR